MKIELDENDIINEINGNFRDDVDFMYRIVDNCTASWHSVRDLTGRLLDLLSNNGEMDNLLDKFNPSV